MRASMWKKKSWSVSTLLYFFFFKPSHRVSASKHMADVLVNIGVQVNETQQECFFVVGELVEQNLLHWNVELKILVVVVIERK